MKRHSGYLVLAVVLILASALGGCWRRPRARPTATPTLTPSPVPPTSTPVATPTPLPTDQPVPAGMVSPIVVQHSPQTGEELSLNGAVELVFDRAMDRGSVEQAFQISPTVSGRFEWSDSRTIRFLPAGLNRGTGYNVYIAQSARDTQGAMLAGAYRFRFATVGRLEVSQVIPAPDSVDVAADSVVTLMFNRPVVPLTPLAQQAALPDPVAFHPPIAGKGEWLNTSVYLFTPEGPLPGGVRFAATIAAGLTDTIGGLLEAPYTWSFSTQPPQVVWTNPPAEAERPVPPDLKILVTFNQPIDAASARSAFTLSGGGLLGGKVRGDFQVISNTLMFTPQKRLAFDQTYTARIEAGVKGAAGGEGMREPFEWRFKTAPLPRIVSTTPKDGERNADSYTAFQITFNTIIDPATVMPNLQMTPPLSPTQVYTYFNEWDYTFILQFGARPSTDYEVRIGSNIADPFGNTTGQRMTVRFRTAPVEPSVRLHVPGYISTANANDPARLVVSYINAQTLDLKLYALAATEFLAFQRDPYSFQPPRVLRTWREKVTAPLNEWQYARIDLAEGGGRLEPGFYLVEATSPDVREKSWKERHLLVVSTINLTIKSADQEMLVWATELDTGRPVSGLSLSLFSWHDGELVGGPQRTDGDGMARFAIAATQYYDLVVLSESPFVAGANDWSQGVSPWEFGFSGGEGYQQYRVHTYTDRPIYRPGQQVHLRGIARREQDVAYTMPDLSSVHVLVHDPNGEAILDTSLPLDAFGAFNSDLSLAAGAPLGSYYINVEVGDTGFAAYFQVAAYRAPEFEVTVKPGRSELTLGQGNRATVDVRYFFGGPVQDVPVEWNILGETYTFEPPQFGRYSFSDTDDPWICRYCWWRPTPPPAVLLSGSGRTTADGQLAIDLPGEWKDEGGQPITHSLKLVVEAIARGRDGQAISGRSEVIAHRSSLYIGLAPKQYVGQAEKEMSVDLLTVDWKATRQANQALLVSVYRREWKNVFVENQVGGGRWEWSTEDHKVTEQRITTGANGEAVFTFVPRQGGSYHVIAESVDVQPAARSSIFVWVSGKEYIPWRQTNDDRIDLVADKGIYVPGETAEILIPSPFQGEQWAWITVERAGILSQQVIQLPSNSYVFRLPITDRHVPNVYVSVVIVKGKDKDNPVSTYKVGYTALTVKPEPQQLTIALQPAVQQAGPGDTVSFDIRATDSTGEPVSAAFSLDLVDKAVLSLQPRQPNAILEAFYGRRALGVNTASGLSISLNRLLIEQEKQLTDQVQHQAGVTKEVERVAMATASPMAAEGKRDAAGAAAAPPPGVSLREEFADTAYWRADFVTDQTGKGKVEIKVPDNLTTWVFRGVGVTTTTKVGEATVELLVTKPLLVRPVAPRFFVVDDEAYLAALVSNNTDQELVTEVALSSTGLTLQDPDKQTITIPAHAEKKVTWRVTVTDVPNAEVIMSAVSGDYSDAARPRLTTGPDGTLTIYRYTAPEVVGTGGQLVGEGARTEVVAMPPRYDDRRGELLIQLDPSLAAGMRDGLTYLEHFPYECTEQTVSRFLPNVLTYRALHKLGISNPELEARLPGLVQEGLQKLYLQQREDGGWGWWREALESNPHISAYVVLALAKAREAGFAVDANALQRALDYLNGQLQTSMRFRCSSSESQV